MLRRSGTTTIWLFVAGLACAVTSWGVYELFAMPAVAPHLGDGQFQNRSWRFPHCEYGVPVAGFTIDFEKFDLSQPFEATYEVERIPLAGNRVGVYLSIIDPEQKFERLEARRPLVATVEISVVDPQGKQLCDVKQSLGKLIWAGDEGGPNTHGLYDLVESFFASSGAGRYEIRIRYLPDPVLAGMIGFVHIRCGGSI